MVPKTFNSKDLDRLIYPYPNLKNWTLDENDLERTCPLDCGRHNIEPEYGLGVLDRLPLELLSDILVEIDIRSLMDFRRVNQRAMEVVDSIPKFQTIMRHSPNSLRGILSIESGFRISCLALFYTLCNPTCESCGDFGGYMYVLTCSRVCFLCLSEDSKYLPLLAPEVVRACGLNREFVTVLTGMRSVPGCYSPNEKICRNRLVLIDPDLAYHAGAALHGSTSAMKRHVLETNSQKWENYRKRIARKESGKLGRNPRRPPDALAIDGRSSNPRRFMAIVHAPWVDLATNLANWGFHCVGCEKEYRRPLHWRRKYTVDTFNDHLNQCGSISNGKHCPPAGTENDSSN